MINTHTVLLIRIILLRQCLWTALAMISSLSLLCCRSRSEAVPLVVHVLRDPSAGFSKNLSQADLSFALTKPHLKDGSAFIVATNETGYQLLLDRIQKEPPDILILDSEGDQPQQAEIRQQLGSVHHVCGQHPAYIPVSVSGKLREASEIYLSFLAANCSGDNSVASDAIKKIRARVPVDLVPDLSPERLAGRYTTTSKEIGRRIGPFLHGNDLYLFPDRTYIYCEWADVEPITVHDKGTWYVNNGVIELNRSADVTWDSRLERKYVAVRRVSHPNEILVIGATDDLEYFEKHAGNDPEFMLLINSKLLIVTISNSDSAAIKTKFQKDSWHPEFFNTPGKWYTYQP